MFSIKRSIFAPGCRPASAEQSALFDGVGRSIECSPSLMTSECIPKRSTVPAGFVLSHPRSKNFDPARKLSLQMPNRSLKATETDDLRRGRRAVEFHRFATSRIARPPNLAGAIQCDSVLRQEAQGRRDQQSDDPVPTHFNLFFDIPHETRTAESEVAPRTGKTGVFDDLRFASIPMLAPVVAHPYRLTFRPVSGLSAPNPDWRPLWPKAM